MPTPAYPDDFPSYAAWQAFLKAQQAAPPAPITPAPASPAPPLTLSGAPTGFAHTITPVATLVAPPSPAGVGGWTLAAREAQVGVIDDSIPQWPEPDDALVPHGVRTQARPGVNLIAAPVAAAPAVPPGQPEPMAEPARASGTKPIPAPIYHTYKKDVVLEPGQMLGYTLGKGYYARDIAVTEEERSARTSQVTTQPTAAVRTLQSADDLPPIVPPGPAQAGTKPTQQENSKHVKPEITVAGHSTTVKLSPPGSRISVSVHSDATVTWSQGRGKVTVHFDPKQSSKISLANGPLTITDPGHLQQAAKRYEKTIKDKVAKQLALPIQPLPNTTTTKHRIVPTGEPLPTVELNLGTKTVHAPLHQDVTITQSVEVAKGKISVKVTVSTAFSVHLPGDGEVRAEYSITAEGDAQPRSKKRSQITVDAEQLTILLLGALVIGAGYVVIRTGGEGH
jgi:mannose-6-phosphate isomerase-like protein (cupin superfamily)